jgi:hypothetical protein
MTILYIKGSNAKSNAPVWNRIHLQCDDNISKVCLKEWSSKHINYNQNKATHSCRNCIRAKIARAGGLVGGKIAAETGQIRFAIDAAATPKARTKARKTMERKGKKQFTSKPENDVYEKCVEWFGRAKRWCFIYAHKWMSIDLYIPSIDTYIEVDGVYWHGLDRSYEALSEVTKKKYDNDRLLDEHCRTNNIKLVRITDKEVLSEDWNKIYQRILSL